MTGDSAPSTKGCPSDADHDRDVPEIDLLSPLTIRGVTLRNRIAVSPMCQYCSVDGRADDWHLVHLGNRAVGGAGLVVAEATAVTPEGRITPGDLGLWSDDHIPVLARIAAFVKRMGTSPAIQLAHAGRKGSCAIPQEGGAQLSLEQGGWQTIAPSSIPFQEGERPPIAFDQQGIRSIVAAFAAAARRAVAAGFEILEIHAAHGYLLHEFLSPLSNQRTDHYGGSLENRMRIVAEVATEFRHVMPREMPLFVRISATDWIEGGWDLQQSIELSKQLRACGADLVDVSSGPSLPTRSSPLHAIIRSLSLRP